MPHRSEGALALLEEGTRRLIDAAEYKQVLEFRARLHRYSARNCLLIALQCPAAKMVAGYHKWQQLGRQVRKGEKAITILAPILRRGEGEADTLVGFRTASVFDVSQTLGAPLPILEPQMLTDDSPAIRDLLVRLEAVVTCRGLTLARADLEEAVNGFYAPKHHAIVLNAALPPLQCLKTLVHELAHALLHGAPDPQGTRPQRELEAESCAFLVCHALGLDTSRYSFPYLAHWANDPEELLPAAERAGKAAEMILGDLNPLVAAPEYLVGAP